MRRMLTIILAGFAAVLIAALFYLYTPDLARPALEARYAAPPSTFPIVAGVRLHLRDTGPRDAPPILFLHGFGASLHAWEDWATALDGDFRVLRIDLPGFGLTGPDPTNDYTDERSLVILVALLDQLRISKIHLVGSSMGGRIAWTFAARHPERIHRLVLMAPDGYASLGRVYGEAPKVPAIARILPYTLPTPLLRASLRPAYADPGRLTEAVFQRYRNMLLAPGVRPAILARMAQGILTDPEPLLRQITAPTLLVWGQADAMVPVTNAADYQRVLPDSRLVSFDAIGHVPMEEDPVRTLPPIREFLGMR